MKYLILFSVLWSSFAWSQTPSLNTSAKRQSLDFEDELVEGQTQKPELFYLLQKKNFNYKRLIKLREDFIPEMKKTAEEIHRRRSRN